MSLNSSLGTIKMAQQVRVSATFSPSLTARAQSLEPTEWKERTDSHTCTFGICVYTHKNK